MSPAGPPGNTNRRRFLRRLAGVAVGAAAWRPRATAADAAGASTVVLTRGGDLRARLEAALDPLGGMRRFVQPGNTVVVKPNAAFGEQPQTGGNTNPEVIAAIVRLCREAGARWVTVAEHCLSNHGLFGTKDDLSGITQAASGAGAEVIDTGDTERNYLPLQLGAPGVDTHPISRYVLEADVTINLPRLKTHPFAGYTMSVKNLMGTMCDPGCLHRDGWSDLPLRLACLARALQPHIALTIIDGTEIVRDWAAGSPGKLTRSDTLLAGTSMVSTDAIGVTLFGDDPLGEWRCATRASYLRLAHDRGWGVADPAQIALVEAGS